MFVSEKQCSVQKGELTGISFDLCPTALAISDIGTSSQWLVEFDTKVRASDETLAFQLIGKFSR